MADFSDERIRARFGELTAPRSVDGMERGGSAYVDLLAMRSEVSGAPMGVVGFCFTRINEGNQEATAP